MQPDFWQERWRTGQIGFHQSDVDRHLKRYWPSLGARNDSPVFVPLCGKSLDLLWLRERGHLVSGVELSAVALESFCMEHGLPVRRVSARGFDIYTAPNLALYCGDFFALTPEILGSAAAIYDRAALISWQPERRQAYARHLTGLTQAGTKALLVTVEYPQSQMNGPPFSVPADVVAELFSGSFSIEELAREDSLSNEPRLRARGLTEMYESCYALTRL